MALRLARPAHLNDINGIAELARLRCADNELVIDACKPFGRRDTFPMVVRARAEVEDLVRSKFGAFPPKGS